MSTSLIPNSSKPWSWIRSTTKSAKKPSALRLSGRKERMCRLRCPRRSRRTKVRLPPTVETKVVREVTKSEDVESFFNFFKSRSAPDADEEDEKLIEEIENDMDIAEEIADALIPQALLYYMDLAVDYGHGEDADKVDSEDSEEETSHKPKAKKSKAETKKECKQ
eukprot:TRINITY_DN3580_c0_g1_i12.p4 TRINITY_DN3580_c0_g1~~TRINITY_DN3580_c0_g1_i12.p4  ORF type:complete len:165 (+),score=35.06 TRINITY_DN3580_c0_g1_i12:782-1276(+)